MIKAKDQSSFVISLDFELFWGVLKSRLIHNYGSNVLGVWDSIPAILNIFSKYDVLFLKHGVYFIS